MRHFKLSFTVGIIVMIISFSQFALYINQPYTLTGMRISTQDEGFIIELVNRNSPAYNSGLRSGQYIVAINDIDALQFIADWGNSTTENIYRMYSKLFRNNTDYAVRTSDGETHSFRITRNQNFFRKISYVTADQWIIILTTFLFIIISLIAEIFTKETFYFESFLIFCYSGAITIFNSYTFAQNTYWYTVLNTVLFDFAGVICASSSVWSLLYFMRVAGQKRNLISLVKTLSFIPIVFFAVKYLLILFGVHSIFGTPFMFMAYASLVLCFLTVACSVIVLLFKTPKQSTILLRFFIQGFSVGVLPTVVILLLRLSESLWVGSYTETFYTIIPLLMIPLSVSLGLIQMFVLHSDAVCIKIESGASTVVLDVLLILIASLINSETNYVFWILIASSPVIYILLERVISNFLSPKIERMQSKLDELERNIFLCPDSTTIFRRTCSWIEKNISAGSVTFCALGKEGNRTHVLYQHSLGVKKIQHEHLKAMIGERNLSPQKAESLMSHGVHGFSVPLFRSRELFGYIYICSKSSYELFANAQIRLMVPVARIVMESIMFFEIMQFRNRDVQIHDAFSRYLSENVVQNLLEHPENVGVNGERKNISIMFTDLQDFTMLTEHTDPEVLVKILNRYLSKMSVVIRKFGGTIDKFEGDAIMSFFGDSLPMENNAERCVEAALEMLKSEEELNRELMDEKLIDQPLHTRIGINSGEVIVGNIGSDERMEYTAIGRHVNIAARIEPLNKTYSTSLMVSGFTYEQVKERFLCRYVDKAELRGISEKMDIYEVIGKR